MHQDVKTRKNTTTDTEDHLFDLRTIRLETSEQHATALMLFARNLKADDLAKLLPQGVSSTTLITAIDELAFALMRDLREQRS